MSMTVEMDGGAEPAIGKTYVTTHTCNHKVRYRLASSHGVERWPAGSGADEPCANCHPAARKSREEAGLAADTYDIVQADGVLGQSWHGQRGVPFRP